MSLKLFLFAFCFFLFSMVILFVSFYIKLTKKHKKLYKFFYNYLNSISSARYGNLNIEFEEGFDNLTKQLSKNTNALLESIKDRDAMISEYIEKEEQHKNIKQDFISSLAHDLKVPIIAQDNTYELFLNNTFGQLNEVQTKAIKNLKISNNDLKNLVINLIDIQKFECEEYQPDFQQSDILALIKTVIEQNQSILTIKEKEIVLNHTKDNFICDIDTFLIKRVLNNLIANAIFYGKNSKTITISLNKTESEIIISIQDEGEGISEENIKNIFKKYYTSAKKYSNIGVGLGLYIANKIILAHRGKLSAKNNKTKGACFSIALPIRK